MTKKLWKDLAEVYEMIGHHARVTFSTLPCRGKGDNDNDAANAVDIADDAVDVDGTIELWFLFLHLLNGRMVTLLRALPRSFRDLHFCFRKSKFKTAVSASFHGVDFFTIFLEVLLRSHGEFPQKLCLDVCYLLVICICMYLLVGRACWQRASTCDILGWVNR